MAHPRLASNAAARFRPVAAPWLAYVLAWVPFAILELVSNALQAAGTSSLGELLNESLSRTAISALLGVGVWWLSGRLHFPDQHRARFYALQLVLSLVFALVWNAIWILRWVVESGWSAAVATTDDAAWLGWQVMMGVWLYLLIAGISYTLRVHRLLREKEVAAARTEALAVRSQLAALRAQLNPHFLFNSLHSLSTLVRHDAAKAEEALGRLGDLLRYALDGAESDDVLLSQEWEFTKNYLGLEELRLGERLRVETSIDRDALDREVPSFVLQPLVENAIRHGIAPRPEGGRLGISIRQRNDHLLLEVTDDGQGAPTEYVVNGRGYGLRVLRQRLEARYGDHARVEVVTAPGSGFAVTVRLPTGESLVAREEVA